MGFRKWQWLFPVAVTLHNCEETITMPKWVVAHSQQLLLHPSAGRIWFGLLVLTVAAFVVTYLSAENGRGSLWAYLLFGYMAAMLANVFIPHIPASLVFGEYTPGVATAVLVNLPLMSILLFQAVREEWVSGTKAAAYAALVPLAIAGGIATLFAVK
jgi:hypothetical protein